MMKKMLLIACILSSILMHAGSIEYTSQDLEMFYDAGICLARQGKINDWQSLKEATAVLYQDIQEVQQIIDLSLMMNGVVASQDTLASDKLMDEIYKQIIEHDEYIHLEMDFITFAESYQKLFCIFIEECNGNPSLITFMNYLDSNDMIDADSLQRIQAALDDFIIRFENIQSTLQDIL